MKERDDAERHRSVKQSPAGAARGRMRALSDAELLAAMRSGDHWAWYEFDVRFRPRMERFASSIGVPTAYWPECVHEVIEDAAMRFALGDVAAPDSLGGYLVRAVRNRALNMARHDRQRHRLHEASIPLGSADTTGGGDVTATGDTADSAARIAALLRTSLSAEEELILGWVAEGVPYRQIASWLEIGYEATAKRIARLGVRLRARLAEHAVACDPRDRGTIERLLGTKERRTDD